MALFNKQRFVILVLWGTGIAAVGLITLLFLPSFDDTESQNELDAMAGVIADQKKSEPAKQQIPVVSSWQPPSGKEAISTDELQKQLSEVTDQLVSLFANDMAAYHVAAMIHAELRQTAKARILWQKCIDLGSKEAGPLVGLASVLMDLGEDQQALDLLEKNKTGFNQTEDYCQKLAECYFQLGELEKGESIALNAMSAFPRSMTLARQVGLIQNQLRNFDSAEKHLRLAIDFGDRSISTQNALIALLTKAGRTDEAKTLKEKVANEQSSLPGATIPGDSGAASDAGSSAAKAANEDSLFQDQYRQALQTICVPLLRKSSSVAFSNGRQDLSEKWIRMALSVAPENLSLLMDLSGIFRASNRIQDAFAVHQLLVERQPENPLNDINLASVASQMQRLDIAETVLNAAIQRHPKIPFLHGELAKVAMLQGNTNAVRKHALVAFELEPNNVEWSLMIAIAAKGKNDRLELQKYLEYARRLAPDDPRIRDWFDTP